MTEPALNRALLDFQVELGKTDGQIAHLLGVTTSRVYRYRKLYGIQIPHALRFRNNFDRKYGDGALRSVVAMYEAGRPLQDIGDLLKFTRENARLVVKKCIKFEICEVRKKEMSSG